MQSRLWKSRDKSPLVVKFHQPDFTGFQFIFEPSWTPGMQEFSNSLLKVNQLKALGTMVATVGPCTISKPRSWNLVEQSKWTSWYGLGKMASTEVILERLVPKAP
ncbi:hypothetical protein L1049_021016 [Liquidambar formosana]|uniref:Uncharacterized protein n=1 Tax=Liquidambar formosana TaxID=63359 RepID=A0AAP0X7W8_LIQFO